MNRTNSSGSSTGSSNSNRRLRHHTMMGGGGSAYDDSYPSRPAVHADTRPQQHRTRRSRPHPDTMSSDMDQQSSPQRPQHEQLSSSLSPAFDFFYSLIFSLVHAALTVVLAPVLGKASKTSRRRQRRDTERPIMNDDDDPELAMNCSRGCTPDNSDCVSVASGGSGSGPYQPILRRESRRLSDLSSAENRKNVRFPEPGAQRARPPLGRIGSSVGSAGSHSTGSSSHTAGSHSTGSSSSRERSSRSSRTASGHRTSSRPSTAGSNNTRPSNSRSGRPQRVRASSPFGRMASPRMAHSTYFLE